MFGLFGKKRDAAGLDPEAPIEVKTSIRIERTPDDIYALLDCADERHHMRARGNEMQQIGHDPDEFRAWSDLAPHLNFLLTVVEAVPGRSYAYIARIVPPVGKRIQSLEAFSIEPLEGDASKLTFVNTIQNQPGLSNKEFDLEVARSTKAVMSFLTKLKIQAEQGIDAVTAFEHEIGQRKAPKTQ